MSSRITTAVVNGMGSASLLLAFPQYFLGLYMLGSTVVSWWSNSRQSSDGYYLDRWIRWLGEGGMSYARHNIDVSTTIEGCDLDGLVEYPWRLPTRLVALYWIITLSKTSAFIVIFSGSSNERNSLSRVMS